EPHLPSRLFPYTTLFRSALAVAPVVLVAGVDLEALTGVGVRDHRAPGDAVDGLRVAGVVHRAAVHERLVAHVEDLAVRAPAGERDRKSTRLNSSHVTISY